MARRRQDHDKKEKIAHDGARGLRSIVESVMTDAMYECPGKGMKAFEVTKDYAAEQLEKHY